ncbi:hypothetical protein Misp01_01210 [Microtetraspora sp. NBRC 13810]|uniref:hypothetical protein n=1 Tax=Microtetraspora sp. NBRC 13810 TaxID=3030990 RepID=UPI0024A1163B|nr:hypothetical protein [Microtetraspora sp. NBRC 13810]GLW04991.1 hypothetical protein Misp01_01210 [Microtetraspora sp. NBRC 13810]
MKRMLHITAALVATGALTLAMAPTALAATSAAPAAGTALRSAADFEDTWGRYSSRDGGRAQARGELVLEGDEEANTLEVSGRLSDRTSRDRQCAQVEFRVVHIDDDEDDWRTVRRYRACDGDSRSFSWDREDVLAAALRVCEVREDSSRTRNCDRWRVLDLGF